MKKPPCVSLGGNFSRLAVHIWLFYCVSLCPPTQSIIDNIYPSLLPAAATLLVYKGLDIKGMNTVRMVWVIIAVVTVLSVFGIIA